jgi:hypothetical protein
MFRKDELYRGTDPTLVSKSEANAGISPEKTFSMLKKRGFFFLKIKYRRGFKGIMRGYFDLDVQ